MENENNQSAIVVSDRKSIVLSIPGKILTAMTMELLPYAHQKKITDDRAADPHYENAMRFYADKLFDHALKEFLVAAQRFARLEISQNVQLLPMFVASP